MIDEKKLKLIANDKALATSLELYLDLTLKEEIVQCVLSGKDALGYKQAQEIITKALRQIVKDYADKQKKSETINENI